MLFLLTRVRSLGSRVNCMSYAAFLCDLLVHAAAHALEQLRHVQKIVRSGSRHVAGNLRQIGVQGNQAPPQQESQHSDPGCAKTKRQVMENAVLPGSTAHQQAEPR